MKLVKSFTKLHSNKKENQVKDNTALKNEQAEINIKQVENEEIQNKDSRLCNKNNQLNMPIAILANKLGFNAEDKIISFFLDVISIDEDERNFFNRLTDKAKSILKEINDIEEYNKYCSDEEIMTYNRNMELEIFITYDKMKAYGFLFSYIGDGKELSDNDALNLIKKEGITYGVDKEILSECISNNCCFKIFTVAQGKRAVDGIDGYIVDKFQRDKQINFSANNEDIIDFKNLNLLQSVKKGDIICDIVQPIPAEDGIDIRGVALRGYIGKIPKPPKGKNVIENEDNTALIAEVDGQLSFSCSLFKIEQLLVIEEDVDNSVGNIDVVGSITIKGNVLDGFVIKASGDITILGSVMGANITAGGNVHIRGGINGGLRGKVTAGGNVSSKYIENCCITSKGIVKSDSILNSIITSYDKVIVLSGLGAIIASNIVSLNSIEANVVGNKRNLQSKFVIGNLPVINEEIIQLKKDIKELSVKMNEYDKNINYLKQYEYLDDKRMSVLNSYKESIAEVKESIQSKTDRINILENSLTGDSCFITTNKLYPPLVVTVGNDTQFFNSETSMSRIYKSENEIIIGNK